MITESDRAKLLQIIQSPQWAIVEQIANSLCDKISYESVVRDTEWGTISESLLNEGQVRGIKRFIQELYTNVQN